MSTKDKLKKEIGTAQRVEILLREGVESTQWASSFDTQFLLDVIREMREQILSLDEQLDRATELLNDSKCSKVGT